MYPDDFARGRPRRFRLPDEWTELKNRYADLGPSDPLTWVYGHVEAQGATAALLEHEYLDRDYRDEYRQFYAQTFRRIPDRCERLHFWADARYLGYSSIRPVTGRPVGRTMLDPGPAFEDDVSCAIAASASPYGESLRVAAFPFISQDRQYGRCAHAVIWMIARYHQMRFGAPQRFMSDIVAAASATETERIVPSKGLTDDQVGSTFRSLGLDALTYDLRPGSADRMRKPQVEGLVRRYLNSGIPMALGTPEHLTALIGGGRTQNGTMSVIQCDDEQGAYKRRSIQLSGDDRWELIMIPLPGRIYLPFDDVEDQVRQQIWDLVDDYGLRPRLAGRNLRYREYAIEVHRYKERLNERGMPPAAARAHVQVPSARWLWLYEMQDEDLAATSPECVVGEIAVDATSDEKDLIFLFANLPGLRATWSQNRDAPDVILDENVPGEPYMTGTALNL